MTYITQDGPPAQRLCIVCKYWNNRRPSWDNKGVCEVESTDEDSMYTLAIDDEGQWADLETRLMTAADFGCVLWESVNE